MDRDPRHEHFQSAELTHQVEEAHAGPVDGSGVLEDEDLEMWRAFLSWSQGIHASVNRAVVVAADLSVPEFEVLTRLWSDPEHEMLQQELTDGLGWSASRASHLLHRLELRGFVHRVGSGYGRARVVQLTTAGTAHLFKAFDAHGRAFRTVLLDDLTDKQRATLVAVMTDSVPTCLPSATVKSKGTNKKR